MHVNTRRKGKERMQFAPRLSPQSRFQDLSPSGQVKRDHHIIAAAEGSGLNARLILLVGLVLTNFVAP